LRESPIVIAGGFNPSPPQGGDADGGQPPCEGGAPPPPPPTPPPDGITSRLAAALRSGSSKSMAAVARNRIGSASGVRAGPDPPGGGRGLVRDRSVWRYLSHAQWPAGPGDGLAAIHTFGGAWHQHQSDNRGFGRTAESAIEFEVVPLRGELQKTNLHGNPHDTVPRPLPPFAQKNFGGT